LFERLFDWKKINWDVWGPTAIGFAISIGLAGAERWRVVREQRQLALVEEREEKDSILESKREKNLELIQELQDSLDTVIISQSNFGTQLKKLEEIDRDTLVRLSNLEKDLQTHRDRWAHEGVQGVVKELERSYSQLSAQIEALTKSKEIEKRIDIVSESVNNTNAQLERLRHIVGQLPINVEERVD
jgi:hypothetical protein